MSAQIKTPTQPSQTARTIETRNNEVNLKKPISKVNSESAFPAILCTRSPVRSRVIIRKRLLRILEALVTGNSRLSSSSHAHTFASSCCASWRTWRPSRSRSPRRCWRTQTLAGRRGPRPDWRCPVVAAAAPLLLLGAVCAARRRLCAAEQPAIARRTPLACSCLACGWNYRDDI